MRRRRLAITLATLIALLALALGAGVAVLELSARDYLLVWRLGHTKRIEWSNPEKRSRVVEITDPREIAAIVEAMTAKLDRKPHETMDEMACQLHFFLDDGGEIVAAVIGRDRETFSITTLIRSAPGEALRPYAVSADPKHKAALLPCMTRKIVLGPIRVGDAEGFVDLDYSRPSRSFWHSCIDLIFRWPGQASVPKGAETARVDFVRKNGVREDSFDMDTDASGTRSIWELGFELEELDSLEVTVAGRMTILKMPAIRFDEPIFPPCPTCGSENVLVCLYDWPRDRASPYKGRCKMSPRRQGYADPSFFCEKCERGFGEGR